ncbi:MAG: transcription elongation factor GreA [bacterium]|nr:transcription elongation factor GreA [bacterium]
MSKQYVTKEKLEELKAELQHLKTVRRLEVAERLKRAKELGDLSENSEYFEAREEQAVVEGRILELDETMKNAELIEKTPSTGIVKVGSTVVVSKGGQQSKYLIVGSNEANPATGLISNESPMGKAFLDRKVGEMTTVTTPKGKIEFKIVAIE